MKVLVSLLTVAFVVLKLTSIIAWSWWWVLSPLWIGVVLWILLLIVLLALKVQEKKMREKRIKAIMDKYPINSLSARIMLEELINK